MFETLRYIYPHGLIPPATTHGSHGPEPERLMGWGITEIPDHHPYFIAGR